MIIQNKFIQKLLKQRNIAAIAALIAAILAGTLLLRDHQVSTKNNPLPANSSEAVIKE